MARPRARALRAGVERAVADGAGGASERGSDRRAARVLRAGVRPQDDGEASTSY